MRYLLFLSIMLLMPNYAFASYRDGFFGFGMLVLGIPILLIGLFISLYYCNKEWFHDRNFTLLYATVWLSIFAILIGITSAASMDGSDHESPKIILVGLSCYYLCILLPTLMQYFKNKKK